MFVIGRELYLLRIEMCMNWENKKNNITGRSRLFVSPTKFQ
jgi:hypothetical protein